MYNKLQLVDYNQISLNISLTRNVKRQQCVFPGYSLLFYEWLIHEFIIMCPK